ncbi:Putative Zinc finger, MYND-type [Septoria linicola]|uniref:Zinc finger, MYND-type n=1 Tax=Septoria linicola TaxID=215465 RepID=A0A9Q9EMN2_9PEZI|nr:putative Zinc finger, MYND-type [Septoria linicola]USW54633.1 Putative Zinc finger, MYND-type [Septoria linicola]
MCHTRKLTFTCKHSAYHKLSSCLGTFANKRGDAALCAGRDTTRHTDALKLPFLCNDCIRRGPARQFWEQYKAILSISNQRAFDRACNIEKVVLRVGRWLRKLRKQKKRGDHATATSAAVDGRSESAVAGDGTVESGEAGVASPHTQGQEPIEPDATFKPISRYRPALRFAPIRSSSLDGCLGFDDTDQATEGRTMEASTKTDRQKEVETAGKLASPPYSGPSALPFRVRWNSNMATDKMDTSTTVLGADGSVATLFNRPIVSVPADSGESASCCQPVLTCRPPPLQKSDRDLMGFLERAMRRCDNCGAKSLKGTKRKSLLHCRKCKTGSYYCCEECARTDWPKHRQTSCTAAVVEKYGKGKCQKGERDKEEQV